MDGWHEDFGDSPAVEETQAYQDYLDQQELSELD
jgi:hypothetical protein